MISKVEKMRQELEYRQVETAMFGMKLTMAEREQDIERIKENIKVSEKRLLELKKILDTEV